MATPTHRASDRANRIGVRTAASAGAVGVTGDNWWLVGTAGLLVYMAQLDTTAVHVALPTIETDLAARATVVQWVVLGYLTPLVGLTLLVGRWLDTVGRRAALAVGAGGFAVSSVAAGLAPDIAWLVTTRAGQGAFAAVLLALAPVMAVQAVRPERRGRALAVVTALAPLGAMTGPMAGGVLLETLGWPWIFFVNAPIAAVAIVIGRLQLPRGGGLRLPRRRWVTEVLLLGGAAVAVLVALSLAADRQLTWLGLAVVAVPLVLAWRRSAVSRPARQLLALPGMAGPHVAFGTGYLALLLTQFLAPFYLGRALGASALVTGTTLLALPAATALASPISGGLSDRVGPQPVAVTGAAISTVALLALLPLSAQWQPVDLAWRLALLGAGFGVFATANMTTAMALAPPDRHGLVAATTNLSRLLGLALGPAAATFAWALSGYTLTGMRAGMGIALLAGAVTLTVAALTGPPPDAEARVAHPGAGAPHPPSRRTDTRMERFELVARARGKATQPGRDGDAQHHPRAAPDTTAGG